MLAKWTEILPLFVIRFLAKRLCERVTYSYEGKIERVCATARPDVLIKII
jgi:hypothetical protein